MTGGILADAHARGISTVLVTCTDGALGDAPSGATPDEDHHDRSAVVAHRHDELMAAAAILGIDHVEELGYADSGMAGWPQNDEPGSFWSTPVADAAARVAALIERYQPDVVVTYDERGFYGHPDHIQANRVTLAAIEATGSTVAKLFYTAIPRSWMAAFTAEIEASSDADAAPPEDAIDLGTDDEAIGAIIDVAPYVTAKRAALAAHGSQTDSSFFLAMPEERFAAMFGREAFVTVLDRTGRASSVDDDLFARLD